MENRKGNNIMKKTIKCPECGAKFTMDVLANGKFECGACGEVFEYDGGRVEPQRQHDDFSCGQKTAKWLMMSFGLDVPNDKTMMKDLHVDKTKDYPKALVNWVRKNFGLSKDDAKFTLPWTWRGYMKENGIETAWVKDEWLVNPLKRLDSKTVNDVLDSLDPDGHSRFAIAYYRCDDEGEYGHWIGVEKHGKKWFVADPLCDTFIPVAKHEAVVNECLLMLFRCRRGDDFPCVELG